MHPAPGKNRCSQLVGSIEEVRKFVYGYLSRVLGSNEGNCFANFAGGIERKGQLAAGQGRRTPLISALFSRTLVICGPPTHPERLIRA